MGAPRKYPQELRDRAQRMVAEAMSEEPDLSLNAAVLRIGAAIGSAPAPKPAASPKLAMTP